MNIKMLLFVYFYQFVDAIFFCGARDSKYVNKYQSTTTTTTITVTTKTVRHFIYAVDDLAIKLSSDLFLLLLLLLFENDIDFFICVSMKMLHVKKIYEKATNEV